jgi:hypothetical protein
VKSVQIYKVVVIQQNNTMNSRYKTIIEGNLNVGKEYNSQNSSHMQVIAKCNVFTQIVMKTKFQVGSRLK